MSVNKEFVAGGHVRRKYASALWHSRIFFHTFMVVIATRPSALTDLTSWTRRSCFLNCNASRVLMSLPSDTTSGA